MATKVTSNFNSVLKDIAKFQAKQDKAMKETFSKIAIESFKEIEKKSVTDKKYEEDRYYLPVPEGNLPKFRQSKTGNKKLSKKNYFSSTKIISRSGELLEAVRDIAKGMLSSSDYVIKISKNKLEVFAITSKAIVLEVKKAGNKSARNIIKKTFRRAINIFRKTIIKGMKK